MSERGARQGESATSPQSACWHSAAQPGSLLSALSWGFRVSDRPGVSKARELAAGRARSAPPTDTRISNSSNSEFHGGICDCSRAQVIAEDCHPFGASYLRRWQACKCKKAPAALFFEAQGQRLKTTLRPLQEEHLSFDCGKRLLCCSRIRVFGDVFWGRQEPGPPCASSAPTTPRQIGAICGS